MRTAIPPPPSLSMAITASRSGLVSRVPRSGFHAAILVIEAHDVVFADVITALNLDHHQGIRAGIFQAVPRFQRDKSRFIDLYRINALAVGDARRAADHHPMLAAMSVHLQR